MTTYIYETIPTKKGTKSRRYEIRQSMKDSPLAEHPETGEAIRRVFVGGYGVLKSGKPESRVPARSGQHCCGASCGCH